MIRKLNRLALVAACGVVLGASLPAMADCTQFNALVTSAELPRGFTDIVPRKNTYTRRDTAVPAEHVMAGFDSCRVLDKAWNGGNPDYGEPQYICVRDMKAGPSGKITFEEMQAQLAALRPQIEMLTGCIAADPRFKEDKKTSMEMSYMMKPELTEMRGFYENPRVSIMLTPMDARIAVEPSDKDPFGMMKPQSLTLIISGIAQDLINGPKD